MYVQRNIAEHSSKHCCSGKAKCFKYPDCVFVALGIEYVIRMRHTDIRGLPCSAVFVNILTNDAIFEKEIY
jgi:hypothetical protein